MARPNYCVSLLEELGISSDEYTKQQLRDLLRFCSQNHDVGRRTKFLANIPANEWLNVATTRVVPRRKSFVELGCIRFVHRLQFYATFAGHLVLRLFMQWDAYLFSVLGGITIISFINCLDDFCSGKLTLSSSLFTLAALLRIISIQLPEMASNPHRYFRGPQHSSALELLILRQGIWLPFALYAIIAREIDSWLFSGTSSIVATAILLWLHLVWAIVLQLPRPLSSCTVKLLLDPRLNWERLSLRPRVRLNRCIINDVLHFLKFVSATLGTQFAIAVSFMARIYLLVSREANSAVWVPMIHSFDAFIVVYGVLRDAELADPRFRKRRVALALLWTLCLYLVTAIEFVNVYVETPEKNEEPPALFSIQGFAERIKFSCLVSAILVIWINFVAWKTWYDESRAETLPELVHPA